MSLASLRNLYHIVGIRDEVESHFNVLLYNAVRYLPHNLEHSTRTWVERYFLNYETTPEGGRIPTDRAWMFERGDLVITTEKLRFGTSQQRNKALNKIILTLLQWLQARYKIMSYKSSIKGSRGAESTASDSNSDPSDDEAAPPRQRQRQEGEESEEMEEDSSDSDEDSYYSSDEEKEPPPTKKDYARAAHLDTFDAVQKLFRDAADWQWLEGEEWRDHIATNPPQAPSSFNYVEITRTPTSEANWVTPDVTGTGGQSSILRLPVMDHHSFGRKRKQKARRTKTKTPADIQWAWKSGSGRA